MVPVPTASTPPEAADADPLSQLARVDRQNRAMVLATLIAAVFSATALLAIAAALGDAP